VHTSHTRRKSEIKCNNNNSSHRKRQSDINGIDNNCNNASNNSISHRNNKMNK
jgi:hypothetical protein